MTVELSENYLRLESYEKKALAVEMYQRMGLHPDEEVPDDRMDEFHLGLNDLSEFEGVVEQMVQAHAVKYNKASTVVSDAMLALRSRRSTGERSV